jgi:hypothetical protein
VPRECGGYHFTARNKFQLDYEMRELLAVCAQQSPAFTPLEQRRSRSLADMYNLLADIPETHRSETLSR